MSEKLYYRLLDNLNVIHQENNKKIQINLGTLVNTTIGGYEK